LSFVSITAATSITGLIEVDQLTTERFNLDSAVENVTVKRFGVKLEGGAQAER